MAKGPLRRTSNASAARTLGTEPDDVALAPFDRCAHPVYLLWSLERRAAGRYHRTQNVVDCAGRRGRCLTSTEVEDVMRTGTT